MEQEYIENGAVIEENEVIEVMEETGFKPTWRRAFCWIAFALSCAYPVIAIGISVMCLSTVDEKEKEDVKVVSYIACGIAAVVLAMGIFSSMALPV